MGFWAGLSELIDIKGVKLLVGEFFGWFLAKTRGAKFPAFCIWSGSVGYQYLSLKNATWDEDTNIFLDIFQESIARINPGIANDDIDRLLEDIKLSLENEDLGKAFYEKLTARSGSRLTDFSNNSFHVVTELTHKNGGGNWAGSVGILHGESMAEEMKLFLKGGYRLEETIRCGSENGAKFFGMERLGRLTVGRKATFLIARGTVQLLPRKLFYLEGIYIDGAPSTAYRKNPVKTA